MQQRVSSLAQQGGDLVLEHVEGQVVDSHFSVVVDFAQVADLDASANVRWIGLNVVHNQAGAPLRRTANQRRGNLWRSLRLLGQGGCGVCTARPRKCC